MGKLKYKKILFFEDINKNKFYVCKKRNGHEFLKVKKAGAKQYIIVNGSHSKLLQYIQKNRNELTTFKKIFFSKWYILDVA